METLPTSADARYPELMDVDVGAELILLSTEPYRFNATHRDALRGQSGLPVCLVDGEMTSWYGSRAIRGLRYLADFTARL
jgi:hypothetical protein